MREPLKASPGGVANTVRGPVAAPMRAVLNTCDCRVASVVHRRPPNGAPFAPQSSARSRNDVAVARGFQGERNEQESRGANDNRCAETGELGPERLRGPVRQQEVPSSQQIPARTAPATLSFASSASIERVSRNPTAGASGNTG